MKKVIGSILTLTILSIIGPFAYNGGNQAMAVPPEEDSNGAEVGWIEDIVAETSAGELETETIKTKRYKPFKISVSDPINPMLKWECDYDKNYVKFLTTYHTAIPKMIGSGEKHFVFLPIRKGESKITLNHYELDAEGNPMRIAYSEVYTILIS
jgi:hypothetical protein